MLQTRTRSGRLESVRASRLATTTRNVEKHLSCGALPQRAELEHVNSWWILHSLCGLCNPRQLDRVLSMSAGQHQVSGNDVNA